MWLEIEKNRKGLMTTVLASVRYFCLMKLFFMLISNNQSRLCNAARTKHEDARLLLKRSLLLLPLPCSKPTCEHDFTCPVNVNSGSDCCDEDCAIT